MSNITTILFEEDSFGITRKSLKAFRNFLCRNVDNHIRIVRVATSDMVCGFFIIDKDNGIAYWSGDGFRSDGSGEGGRGYRNAILLLDTFGVRYDYDDEIMLLDYASNTSIKEALLTRANKLAGDEGDGIEFFCMQELNPKY